MPVSFSEYQKLINPAKKILLIYGEKARFPAVAAATSFYLWLVGLDKQVTLACAAPALVEFCTLVAINKVTNSLPRENLVITIPYGEGKIDKVLSDLDEAHRELSLIVKPQKHSQPLDGSLLKVSYQIPDYDLIIMIDVRSNKELSRLAGCKPHPWQQREKILTIASGGASSPVAAVCQTTLADEGFCHFTTNLFRSHQIKINADVASNLLMGLEKETDSFRQSDSAEIFELAAWLVHQGAVRYRPDPLAVQNFMPKNHLPQNSLPAKYREAALVSA